MAANEKTSQAIGAIAARGLKDPTKLTKSEIRKLAASALTQVADKKKKAAKAKAKPKPKSRTKKKP